MNQPPQKPKGRSMARRYLAGQKWYARISLVRDALWTGMWLGLMSHRDFHAVDETLYEDHATYRSDAHNGRGLFPWEELCLSRYFPPAGSLLVIGAGGGREVLSLWSKGYAVEGYECNPALVEFATDFLKRRDCPATVEFVARDSAPTGVGPYDGVIVGWSAYMLIPGRKRRIEFLRATKTLLKEESPVLLSFFTRVNNTPRLRIVKFVGATIRRLSFSETVEMGDDLAPNYVHRFTRDEIAREMEEAGFSLVCYQPQGKGPHDSGYAMGQVCASRNEANTPAHLA